MSINAFIQHHCNTLQLSPSSPVCLDVVVCAMAIIQIVMGAATLDECPRQHYIPIYLIVAGYCELVLQLLSVYPPAREPSDGKTLLRRVCTYLTSAFFFCWVIAGSWWIISIYEPDYNNNTTDVSTYCNKMLYQFSFFSIMRVYTMFILSPLIRCCIHLCLLRCERGTACVELDDKV